MSKRDSFFFPHEYNAKDDPKCEQLIWSEGQEGYGIFWTLLEVLRAQPDYTYPVSNIPIIARKYNADTDKMRRVVFDYGLFTIVEDRIFFSQGLTDRMAPLDQRRIKLSEAGKKGNKIRWNEGNLSGGDSLPNRHPNRNNIRVEYIREDNKGDCKGKPATTRAAFVAPSLEELRAYVSERGLTRVYPEEFIDFYAANGWRAGKNPMKDWRAAARNWNRRNDEFTKPTKRANNETSGQIYRAFDEV